MADDFDPYYTWLGIPPEEQPADHYRLLGVRRFESNGDVITNAMDQRMHYLRSLQVGKRSALSQKILNEVSAAGIVLLDPKRRGDYDQQLRAQQAAAVHAAAPPLPTAAAAPAKAARPLLVAASLPQPAAPVAGARATSAADGVVVAASPAVRSSRAPRKASMWGSPAVLGGVAFAAVAVLGLVGLMVVLSMQKGDQPVVENSPNNQGGNQGSDTGKSNGDRAKGGPGKEGKTPAVDPPSPATAAAPWTTDADSARLFVLDFDKRSSVEIDQTAQLANLAKSATIEGWFKLKLDSPQTMSLFGTRSGGSMGTATKGWVLSAIRRAAQGKMVDQLVLELWKVDGKPMAYATSLPQPGHWHHVALAVADGKEWWLFVDGKRALNFPSSDALSISSENLRLGDDSSGRGNGMEGQVCGLRISDSVRYQKPFSPPAPLAMSHDASTAAALHFTLAVPNAAAGTIRQSGSEWQYGHGRYDEETKKVAGFVPMLEWNGLQWKPGPSLPQKFAEWMSLDPLGGHAGNGPQHAVIRRWTSPADGTLTISGKLTHAHETRFGDGVRGRIVSSASGQAGEWDSVFKEVDTTIEKLPVSKGDAVDFLVECKNDNHCDKFAWLVHLALTDGGGAPLAAWDSDKSFSGPNQAGAVYQLARLHGARWQRLDPSQSVSLTQLAPIASLAPAGQAWIDVIQEAFDGHQHMRGEVKREGNSLRTKANLPTAFMLPLSFPEEYDLEAEVIRESGVDSICFGFPVPGGRRMTAIVDGQKGTRSGLAAVNDKQIFAKDNPLVRQGPLLTSGKPAIVRISVDQSAVELLVDGTSIARWKVNSSDKVLLAKGMGYTNPKAMAVFTWDSPFRINRLELIPKSGGVTPPVVSEEGRIDLVQKHARSLQVVRGSLSHTAAEGWKAGGNGSAFMIPETVPSEYVLEAEVTREDGAGSISFHLPVRGMPLSAIIDIYDARLTGLSDINDWNIQSASNPTVHRGPVLTNGQPAQVRIVVSQREVSLSVDGKKLSSWACEPGAKLNAYQGLRLPDPQKLGVTTGNSTFRIKRMDLMPVAAGSEPPGNPPLAGGPVELIDASRQTVRGLVGSHQVSGNVLSTADSFSRVAIDGALPDEYTLEGEITRLGGDDTLGIGFTVQGRPLCVLIDGWHSQRSGICLVPGQDPANPAGPTMAAGPVLTNNQPARLRLSVNRQEVKLDVDDKTVARWDNDSAAELRAFKDYDPDGNQLTISTWSNYRLAGLKLTPGGVAAPPMPAPASGFAGPKKAPIPSDAAKSQAQPQFVAVFGDDLKAAKTPQAKAIVARKISDMARETNDLPAKYLMFEEARKLFVEIKDISSVMQIVDAVSQDFDVSAIAAKARLLETLSEGNLGVAQRAEVVAEACSVGYEAIDSNQFDIAQSMANVARAAAARANSAEVKAEAKDFTDEFAQKNKRWESVRKAEQVLAASPDDPAANLALGLYHFFGGNDQAKGLSMLLKGSDPKLAAAAKARQQSASQGLANSLAEADAWFDCLASIPAEYKAALQTRTWEAYELAIASAEGLDKARAEKRANQLKADLASASASAPGTKRGPRLRMSELPESSPGMVGRVFLNGKDDEILVTFDPRRNMDTQKLRDLLAQAKAPGGRIVLVSVLSCPTPMSMYINHRGASTAATQQVLVNGKVLSTVGGKRGDFDSDRLQLVAGNHLIQWVIEFDGSTAPSLNIYEDGNSRRVPLNFTREQNYAARKLTTKQELYLTN